MCRPFRRRVKLSGSHSNPNCSFLKKATFRLKQRDSDNCPDLHDPSVVVHAKYGTTLQYSLNSAMGMLVAKAGEHFMSAANPEVTIVVPFFNEEDNVLPLAEEIAAAMKNVARSY